MTRDQCEDYLVNTKGVPEEVAVRILELLDLFGPYEVRMMLPPNVKTPVVIRSLTQGEFEVSVA